MDAKKTEQNIETATDIATKITSVVAPPVSPILGAAKEAEPYIFSDGPKDLRTVGRVVGKLFGRKKRN